MIRMASWRRRCLGSRRWRQSTFVLTLMALTLVALVIPAVVLAVPDCLARDAIMTSSSAAEEEDARSGHSSSSAASSDGNATPSSETKPAGVVVTGEVVACAQCSNMKVSLPELWSFLIEGEIDYYHGVTKTWKTSGSPQVILSVYRGGRYTDSIVLNDDDAWTKREYHQIMRSNGFRLKDATGRRAAKEAAEKEIREEAAWSRYHDAYFRRRDRHVEEFRSRVMSIDPSIPDCPSNRGCVVASSAGGGLTTKNLPTPVLEENYNKNNRRGYLYAKTGRKPKKRSMANANQSGERNAAAYPDPNPKADSDRDPESSHRRPTNTQTPSKSHPLGDESPSHLILEQRKADIREKLRAITRRRILTTAITPGSPTTTRRRGRRRRYRLSSRRKSDGRRQSTGTMAAPERRSQGSYGANPSGSDVPARHNRRPVRRPTSRGRMLSTASGRRKAQLATERTVDFKDAFVMSPGRHQKPDARKRVISAE